MGGGWWSGTLSTIVNVFVRLMVYMVRLGMHFNSTTISMKYYSFTSMKLFALPAMQAEKLKASKYNEAERQKYL